MGLWYLCWGRWDPSTGIALEVFCSYNRIGGNNIENNGSVIYLDSSSDNKFYHNNFINNTGQVNNVTHEQANFWDNGCEGNYWSNYTGANADHDCIGDTPYIIDADNTDHYPLMTPYIIPEFPMFFILPLMMSVTLLAVTV